MNREEMNRELRAMRRVMQVLGDLDGPARRRVAQWAQEQVSQMSLVDPSSSAPKPPREYRDDEER